MSDPLRIIDKGVVRFVDPSESDPYSKTTLRPVAYNPVAMTGPAKTTLSGTVKDSTGTGVKRSLRIFSGPSFISLTKTGTSASDGTFSIEVDGNDNDEFTVIAIGNQGEDHAIVSRVKGEAT